MKKRFVLLVLLVLILMQGCTSETSNTNTTNYSKVFEYSNVNFFPNQYSALLNYPYTLSNSDMVLVYRLSGSFQGEAIWKPLPETYFFDDGTLDIRYDYNFTRFDAEINLEGFDLQSVSNNFKLNQVFRVVVIPGFYGKNKTLNLKNYKTVSTSLSIDENQIIKIKL